MPLYPNEETHRAWAVLEEHEIFARKPYVTVVQQSVRTGHGRIIDDFYQVKLRSFALVVPILDCGHVQVIRQYKHGPGRVGLGFAAGFLEADEEPRDCAMREMREEMGLGSDDVVALGSYVDNGNQRGCQGHYFLARNCRVVAEPDPGDLEEFEYLNLTVQQVDQALRDGLFSVIHHVAAWGLARPFL